MRNIVLAAIIIMSAIYIFYIPADPVGFKIFMKLIPMALIILFAAMTSSLVTRNYKSIVIAGLFVCMIADGVIYWFMAGLITFFIGHLFYIFAFKSASRQPVPKWAAILLVLYGIGMAFWIAGSQFIVGESILGAAIIAYIVSHFDNGMDGNPDKNATCHHRCPTIHVLRLRACYRQIRSRYPVPGRLRHDNLLRCASFHRC